MILNERDARHEHILQVARQMMTAARTAPKGKGIDIIEVALITDEDIKLLSDKMIAMVEEHGMKFFLRDADNILSAECVVLIGTREQAQGLNCGHCGFATCVAASDTSLKGAKRGGTMGGDIFRQTGQGYPGSGQPDSGIPLRSFRRLPV